MRTVREIVEDYKKADFHDRIVLFLTHRDLRDEFMDIEAPVYQNRVKKDQVRNGK